MAWNLGDLLDGVGAVVPPDAEALIHGDDVLSWAELNARSNNLARHWVEQGASPGDKLAFYMRNRVEYLVTLVAAFKARLTHVNVNYRYLEDELHYILDNSDAHIVVFGDEFEDRIASLRGRLPKVKRFVQVGGATPDYAEDFGTLCTTGDGSPLDIERSPEDQLFIYTGGTTGMPKGVMWQHKDLWGALGAGATMPAHSATGPPETPEAHFEGIEAHGPGSRMIVACPLMHGTGLLTAINNLLSGGCCMTLTGAGFDAEELFDMTEQRQAQSLIIVGDAFAKPMLNALDASPGRWKLDSLQIIISSGVMWSQAVKQGLIGHHPTLICADMFGSSEAVGFGSSMTSKQGGTKTAKFQIGPDCRVFTEDHQPVEPGSGERGFIARPGPIPLGYYKDEEKTAKTFPTIEGVRYSVPGDWCTVEADGTLNLLGRGSVCINSAGEKIYPEEVEEALKTHAEVEDALVVGLPDEKWGQAVTGVVELRAGSGIDEAALRAHVREKLAGYKTPKRVFIAEKMFRAPNGKADYKGALAFAEQKSGS